MKNIKILVLYIILFAIVFFLFIIKIPFTFIADDSPETVSCFHLLNIQHPPGYPLNTLTGKIFTLIPLAGPVVRANFTSVFFHLLTSLVLFFIVSSLFKNEKEKYFAYITGLFAVVFYLFSNTAFFQAMSVKGSIYTLHSFLTAVIFYSLLKVNKQIKYLYLISFAYALTLTNHWPSAATMLPAIVLYLFFSKIKINGKNIHYSILFFIIGLTPFLFLFIRSYNNPDIFFPVKDIRDFIWMFGRKQYSAIDTAHSINDTIRFLKYLFTNILPEQYPYLLILLTMPGIIIFYKHNRNFCLAALTAIVCVVVGIAAVNIMKENLEWVVKPYLTFTYIFYSIFISFVFYKILSMIRNTNIVKGVAIATIVFILFILYKNCPDYSRYYLAYDYVRNYLKTLPEESIFFAMGDLNAAGSIYATAFEKKEIFYIIPSFLNNKWYREYLIQKYKNKINLLVNFVDYKDFIKQIVLLNSNKKIFFSYPFKKDWFDFDFFQKGIVNEIIFNKDFNKYYKSYLFYKTYSLRGAFDRIRYDEATKFFILDNYGRSLFDIGKIFENNNIINSALFYFNRALIFFKNDILAYKIGLYYFNFEEIEKSEYYFKKAIEINKKNIDAYESLVACGVYKQDYKMMRKYAKEILKYDKKNIKAINLLKEIGK